MFMRFSNVFSGAIFHFHVQVLIIICMVDQFMLHVKFLDKTKNISSAQPIFFYANLKNCLEH